MVFVETVFELSFGFTYVLFGAVVVLYHVGDVFGVAVDVMREIFFRNFQNCPEIFP